MRTPVIETERLILRPITMDDCQDAYDRWTSDPEVAKYMIYNTHTSIEDTKGWLSTIDIDSDTDFDFAVCVKDEDNYMCGSCGLSYKKDIDCFVAGYNFARDHWRKGYGTETMQALVKFGTEVLHQTVLESSFHKENVVSGHVLEKCGFEIIGEGNKTKLDGTTPFEFYEMRYRIKPSKETFKLYNGVEVEPVGFGTYKSSEGAVRNALDAGYTYLDTASYYFNEDVVGSEVKASGIARDKIFIASKVWPTQFGYEETKKAFGESIEKLGTDYLDLYLVHWPKLTKDDIQWKRKLIATWKAMEELYKEGKIRAIGVSNFMPHHMKVILDNCDIKPMVNQLELHIGYMQNYAVEFCRKNDIHVQAWSPLGRGRLNEDEIIQKFARKYAVSPQKLMLRFLVQQGISVIPKANNPVNMKNNLDIYDFTISDEDMSFLMSLPERGFSGEFPDLEDFEN
ncbi:Aldo/keto reductase [Oscillospiraceae bacterium]|nr:Aldo/keto reductase [Oscillospiraceae bacterium]